MNYFGASINQSPTIAEQAGKVITNGKFLAVKYDTNGNVVLCDTAGELALGVLLPEIAESVAMGEGITIQIKNIGLVRTGAAIKKGQEVMTDAQGRVIPATTGKFVLGYAMGETDAEDGIIQVDIRKSGYKA